MHPDAKATIQYGGDGFFIAISPSGHSLAIDTSQERNNGPRPMEMLLMALGACTGVDVVSILKKKREQVTDYRIEVRGERRKEVPRGYERIEVRHILRGHNLSEKAVAQAVELSDTKYCSVAATLRAAEIVTSLEIIEDGDGSGFLKRRGFHRVCVFGELESAWDLLRQMQPVGLIQTNTSLLTAAVRADRSPAGWNKVPSNNHDPKALRVAARRLPAGWNKVPSNNHSPT